MTAQGEDVLAWLDTAISQAESRADRWHDAECSSHGTTIVDLTVLHGGATLCDCDGPASVRRRCAADRKLLELHSPVEMTDEMADACKTCEVTGDYPFFPCATVRALAEGYGWTGGER